MPRHACFAVTMMLASIASASAQNAARGNGNAPPTGLEEALMAPAEGEDQNVQQLMRNGAHLVATKDLSELTGAIKEAERVLQEAFKGVDPADLKALKDYSSKAPR